MNTPHHATNTDTTLASPTGLPSAGIWGSRVVVVHVDAVLKGGIFLLSACLFSEEGLSERNTSLTTRVAVWFGAMARPFIFSADWNLVPSELAESGVLQQLAAGGAAIVSAHTGPW